MFVACSMLSVKSFVSEFSVFGFSGSRRGGVPVEVLSGVVAAVPVGSRVFVGCAAGVDEFFRGAFPGAEVFSVRSGAWGSGRGAFAGRSVALVRAVCSAGGLWVSFPAAACPASLVPSAVAGRCFSGSGSGSWASLGFALGSGLPCLVFLGAVPVPAGWGLVPVVGCAGWFRSVPVPCQLSLF